MVIFHSYVSLPEGNLHEHREPCGLIVTAKWFGQFGERSHHPRGAVYDVSGTSSS